MKRLAKSISVLLVMALVIAMAAISTLAADAESVAVITSPTKTVYTEGIDNIDTEIYCDPTGMVLEVTFADGTTEQIIVDEDSYVDMIIYDYVIGENEADVTFYGTDDYDTELTTTVIVTVEESPVASVEITKMPKKTEYDMEKDVLTRDTLTLDKLYELDPDMFDEMLGEMGMTFDEMKDFYEENPEFYEMMLDIMFAENDELLLIDTTGMEILVTFKDGTTQTISDEENLIYNGEEYPVYVSQVAGNVTEGENTFVVEVLGVEEEFTVTVVSKDDDNNDDNNNNNTNNNTNTNTNTTPNKNPVIPNTDGGASMAAIAVIALASGLGIALIPSKKEK